MTPLHLVTAAEPARNTSYIYTYTSTNDFQALQLHRNKGKSPAPPTVISISHSLFKKQMFYEYTNSSLMEKEQVQNKCIPCNFHLFVMHFSISFASLYTSIIRLETQIFCLNNHMHGLRRKVQKIAHSSKYFVNTKKPAQSTSAKVNF